MVDVITRQNELRKQGKADEAAGLRQYCWSSEIGRFQGWDEAVLMAEMLHEGGAGLPGLKALLAQFGWVFEQRFENHRGIILAYRNPAKDALRLTTVSGEGRIDLDLDRANGWYNLGSLAHGEGKTPIDYPSQAQNYQAIFVQWAQRLIDLRRARGGMFRKPLSESDFAEKVHG
jgi:hypothetical protein